MKRIILLVLSVITGLLFINGGLNKFLNYMPVPDDLPEALQRDFAAEIVGGALLLFPRTRALGTLVLIPVATGIFLTHLLIDPAQLVIPVVIWTVLVWIILADIHKFLPLVRASPSKLPSTVAADHPRTAL